MILTSLGKELIIINEELAIYLSFLIVLTILITNFGKQLANEFANQANQIAENYSVGTNEKVKNFQKVLTGNYKQLNYIINLVKFDAATSYNLLKLKNTIVLAVLAENN